MHGVTQSALLRALGWSLFDSLWQMALLRLFYLMLVSVFRKMAAHSRHGLAILFLGLGAGLSILSFIVHYGSAAHAQSPGPWSIGTGLTGSIDALLPYGSLLYLLILSFLFARCSNVYFHARRLRSEGLLEIDPALRVFVAQTARRLGIKKEVGVWLSSLVEGPVTLGFLRPVILMPFAMVNNLSLAQVEAILLHELAHIKRYDYFLNLGVTVLQLFFFFNPFARQLIRDIRKEREHRCDDLVMQFSVDPFTYASALLSLATTGQRRQTLALAATGRNDRLLLRRVQRIMKQDHSEDRPGTRSVVFFLFAALTAFITLTRPAGPAARLAGNTRFTSPHAAADLHSAAGLYSTTTTSARELFYTPSLLKKRLASREKRPVARYSSMIVMAVRKKRTPALTVGQDDQLSDQELPIADIDPVTINIQAKRMIPVEDTTLSSRLLATLTDESSSAREVKANILRALAANETALRKTQAALNSGIRALREIPASGQAAEQSGQRSERLFLEEQLRLQRQDMLMQQAIHARLESAVKKLTIVYI